MSFLAQENSVEDGQPIELYRFSNVEEVFTFTSGQFDVVFNNETYTPIAVSREDIDQQDSRYQRLLNVNLPASNSFVQRYITLIPATIDQFELFRQHTTDGATPETVSIFSGQVMSVEFVDGVTAKIAIQTFGAILDRLIPQQTSRNPCNHILYDSKCGVTDTLFSLSGVVSAIAPNGLEITIDTGSNTVPNTGLELTAQLADDPAFFNAGLISRGSIELRMIRATVDDGGNEATLTVIFPMQTLSIGTSITIFAGCDHQLPTCRDKFANADRYGGFPFIPLKNPFVIGVD